MSARPPPPPPLAVLRGHDDSVISLKFLSKELLFSGAANGKLHLWRMDTLRSACCIPAHEASILSISVDSDKRITTQSRDGTMKLWDSHVFGEQSQPVRTLKTGFDHFCNASQCIFEGCNVLVSPGMDQSEIILWDTRAPQPIARHFTPPGAAGMVTSLKICESTVWSSNGGGSSLGVLAGYEDGTLFGLDLRMYRSPLFSQRLHSEAIFALDSQVGRKGTQVMTGGGDSILQRSVLGAGITTEETSVQAMATEKVDLPHAGTGCVKYRCDGRIIVSTHWDGSVRVFEHKRLKPLAILRHHRDSVYAVDFSPWGTETELMPATTTKPSLSEHKAPGDGTPSHKPDASDWQHSYTEPLSEVSRGCSFHDGIFATGSKDHTIAIWDVFAA